MFGQEESGRAAGGRRGRQGRLFMAAGCSYIMSGRRQGERERGGDRGEGERGEDGGRGERRERGEDG